MEKYFERVGAQLFQAGLWNWPNLGESSGVGEKNTLLCAQRGEAFLKTSSSFT
jgi:hypothetical protein